MVWKLNLDQCKCYPWVRRWVSLRNNTLECAEEDLGIEVVLEHKPTMWPCMKCDSFFLNFIYYLFIYFFFLAVLGLRFCARAFSSCGKRGPLFIAVRGPLTIAASLVAEHRLQTRKLSSCGSQAQLLRGMWDSPRPGLEPMSPALAGGFSTTAPPGKPPGPISWKVHSARAHPRRNNLYRSYLLKKLNQQLITLQNRKCQAQMSSQVNSTGHLRKKFYHYSGISSRRVKQKEYFLTHSVRPALP